MTSDLSAEMGKNAPSASTSTSMQTSMLQRLMMHEHDSWQRFNALYGSIILSWCRSAGLQSEDAADVRQEVFQSVARKISLFRRENPNASFRGWLWTITHNKLCDFWRRNQQIPHAPGGTSFQQHLQALPAEQSDSLAPATAEETGMLFRRALELIQTDFEPRTWQAFWRVAIEGESVKEVATLLAMTPGAVYVAKSRVLQRLRQEFGELLH